MKNGCQKLVFHKSRIFREEVLNYGLDMSAGERLQGFHSNISQTVGENGQAYLQKAYREKAGGINIETAQAMVNHMQRFDTLASQIGIPVATSSEFFITPNGHPNTVTLNELVPYSGPDLRYLITNNKLKIEDILVMVERVLFFHKKVWDSKWQISLDPPLANFCWKNGELVYIDKMPPRQRFDNGSMLSEYPDPSDDSRGFIEDRYFSPRQARVIYAQILRDLRHHKDLAPAIKRLVGRVLGQEAETEITFNTDEVKRILLNPYPTDVDAIRIFAGEAYAINAIDDIKLSRVYSLTHIRPGGVLPNQVELREAVSELLG